MGLACLCVLAAAQEGRHRGSSPSRSMPWPANAQSNLIILPSPGGNPQVPAWALARKPEFKFRVLPPSVRLQAPAAPPAIPAGVYKTEPYSCIVVVPGAHPDDRCIINPGGGDYSMPIVKPDLQFIPYRPGPGR